MSRGYKPEKIINMLREVEVGPSQGKAVGQACRTPVVFVTSESMREGTGIAAPRRWVQKRIEFQKSLLDSAGTCNCIHGSARNRLLYEQPLA
jgi:hypothetical protein